MVSNIGKGMMALRGRWLICLTAGGQLAVCLFLSGILIREGYNAGIGILSAVLCVALFLGAVFLVRGSSEIVAKEDWDSIFLCWRLQRHDFNNHLQIIYTMIQLGKSEKALEYINTIKRENEVFSTICRLENPRIISEVSDIILSARQEGISIFLDIPDDFNPEKISQSTIKSLREQVRALMAELKSVPGERDLNISYTEPDKVKISSNALEGRTIII
ncbi:sensor kinase SpoOB-type protein [Thermosediminibacter litoriperuensis]|uniref:Sensor kinase SpoOB-type protein n=2 Tax=Thermosediminibacter litoriperuensis TaxID=291989 RepID=A0A5S5AW60_9FIRM|nr:sensor kinase SpoOB-type protein [Thermosediminibacter litoriperuensis]